MNMKNAVLKKFFDEDHKYTDNDGNVYYQVPLDEYMKTEEFKTFPAVTRVDTDSRTGKDIEFECHFMSSSCWTDVYPHMIISKSPSELTVEYVDLDAEIISGSGFDGSAEYRLLVNVDEKGLLVRKWARKVQRARKKIKGKFVHLYYFKNGCEHFVPNQYPRYYRDPSF